MRGMVNRSTRVIDLVMIMPSQREGESTSPRLDEATPVLGARRIACHAGLAQLLVGGAACLDQMLSTRAHPNAGVARVKSVSLECQLGHE